MNKKQFQILYKGFDLKPIRIKEFEQIVNLFSAFGWIVDPLKQNAHGTFWNITSSSGNRALLSLTNEWAMSSNKTGDKLEGEFEGLEDNFFEMLSDNGIEIAD